MSDRTCQRCSGRAEGLPRMDPQSKEQGEGEGGEVGGGEVS